MRLNLPPAKDLIEMSPVERGKVILESIPNFKSITDELEKASAIAGAINIFVNDYFDLKIARDKKDSAISPENLPSSIDAVIKNFLPTALMELRNSIPTEEALIKSSKNIYEMSGAARLAFANKATRNLSTTMGLLWERLADISPYAINPELEFNLKVKGIDLISRNIETSEIEYQQLKTQHNTLTGSQKSRSVSELSLHQNPVFCAAFSNSSSWTFSHESIPRVSGEQFWGRIGISYKVLLAKVKELILQLENEYVSMLKKKV